MQYYPDLFEWWAISISFSVFFMTVVAIYLYVGSRTKRRRNSEATGERSRLIGNFVFVWVLVILLILYVVSINLGSYVLFALGNIAVEIILIAYVAKNRSGKTMAT
jgi:uncharacterized membrane protein